jgi:NAD(P)H-hydrate repair Nnr-like enzyme with NAD(P)H-hydrate dehydratase domain
MTPEFIRQDSEPLYPKVLWNRPVARSGAGRLLLVGGHKQEFSQVTTVHQYALAAGVGQSTVVLPDSLRGLLAEMPDTLFVPSSVSGSLGRAALADVLEAAEDYDGLGIGGSLSNNSETAILIESTLAKAGRPIALYDDAFDILQFHLPLITDQPNHLAIVTMQQIFKIAGVLAIPITIKKGAGLVNKLEIIRDVVAASKCDYVVYGSELIVATEGQMTVTACPMRLATVPPAIFGVTTAFWLQNQSRPLEGLTTAAYVLAQATNSIETTQSLTTAVLSKAIRAVIARD